MPVYILKLVGSDAVKLIDAKNSATAKNHVLKPLIESCDVATTSEAVKLLKAGTELETASGEG